MALLYVTTDMLKWGTGTGVPLEADEIDNNFWQLHERVLDLETNPPTAVGISNIQVIGSQLMIFLSDGSEFGPYTLPIATFNFRGEVQDGAPYFELDIISALGFGLFLVREDHVAELPFDENRMIGGLPAYLKLFGDDPFRYDIGCFIPGKPGLGIQDNKRIYSHLCKTDVYFLEDLGDSEFLLETAPAADLVIPIRKNNTVVGTLTFAATTIEGVVDMGGDTLQLNDGDRISLMKPTAVDSAALELTGTFVGRRGTLP